MWNGWGVTGAGKPPIESGRKNNERPETLSSPGRPGSPPPELLIEHTKSRVQFLPMALPCYVSPESAIFNYLKIGAFLHRPRPSGLKSLWISADGA